MIDFDAARQAALARLYRAIDRRIARAHGHTEQFANRSAGQRLRRQHERERRKHD